MNVHLVWQTTYRLNLFGYVPLKHFLFDLNEFRIRCFAIIFYHEESLI